MRDRNSEFRSEVHGLLNGVQRALSKTIDRLLPELAYGNDDVVSLESDLELLSDLRYRERRVQDMTRQLDGRGLEDLLGAAYDDILELQEVKWDQEERIEKLTREVDNLTALNTGLEAELIELRTELLTRPKSPEESEEEVAGEHEDVIGYDSIRARAFRNWTANMLSITEFVVSSEAEVYQSVDNRNWPREADVQFQEVVRVSSRHLDGIGVVMDAEQNEYLTPTGTIADETTLYYRVAWIDEHGQVQSKWLWRDEMEVVDTEVLTEDEQWCVAELFSLMDGARAQLSWEQENGASPQLEEEQTRSVAVTQQTM